MKYAVKGNRSCAIQDQDVQDYIAKGYDIVDDKGGLVEKAVSTDYQALKHDYETLLEENKKLKAEIDSLKAAKTKTTPANADDAETKTKKSVKADK